jgi:hypothetical protein
MWTGQHGDRRSFSVIWALTGRFAEFGRCENHTNADRHNHDKTTQDRTEGADHSS